jgi:hypothetical protein
MIPWYLMAFWLGLVSFGIPAFAYTYGVGSKDGRTDDLFTQAFVTLLIILSSEHCIVYL